MVYKRAHPSSDYGLDFVSPPKCLRRALSLPPSSPPRPDTPDDEDDTGPLTPVAGPRTPDSDDSVEAIDFLKPLPALLFPESSTVASGSAQAPQSPQTPSHRGTQRAESLEPRASSPMSIVDITPLKPKNKRGRPTLTPQTRLLRQTVRKLSSSQRSPDKRTYDAARETLQRKATALAKERAAEKAHEQQVEADLAAARKAEEQAAIQTAQDAEDTRRAQEVIRKQEEIGQNKLKLGLGAHSGLYDPFFKVRRWYGPGSTKTWWHWMEDGRKEMKLNLGGPWSQGGTDWRTLVGQSHKIITYRLRWSIELSARTSRRAGNEGHKENWGWGLAACDSLGRFADWIIQNQ
ncbi:hypothetical protein C8R44DRAFT_729016 [Mycena epipterygia]|nr:hypothetical protein C8R44DRAFT_729016 [Mycena epipterygia]